MDTASYANIRRMLLGGSPVPEDAVRIEEMLNYFYYDYPEPKEQEPFSVTTRLAECPWNQPHSLLQIGLQAKKLDEDALPASNLVFLLDVSGSMDAPAKLDLVKRAFLTMTENLKDCLLYTSGELEKPARDPRDEMPKPILRSDILEMKDLKPGMVLKGTVRNVIDLSLIHI